MVVLGDIANEQLLEAQRIAEDELLVDVFSQAAKADSGSCGLGFENVVGVGLSERVISDQPSSEAAVAVLVARKAPPDQVDPIALIPKSYADVPTDVVETGELVAQTERARLRPAMSGISIAHHAGTAGTLGFVAQKDGELQVVSNNHVLALANAANVGDDILQPGPADGGGTRDTLATLAGWVELDFTGGDNYVDAAYATVDSGSEAASEAVVLDKIYGIGDFDRQPADASLNTVVRKSGRGSGVGRGIVSVVNTSVKVRYGGRVALLRDQLVVVGLGGGPFSEEGDSGSLVLDEQLRRPVGLICGGGRRGTVVNRIQRVLDQLQLSFA
jgi:hypothetical protein